MARTKDFLFKYRMRFGQLAVGDWSSGNSGILTGLLRGSKTMDWGSVADAATLSTTVTVTGAALGDMCLASMSLDVQELAMSCAISAANTAEVSLVNDTGSAVDLASGTLAVLVFKSATDA